MSAWIDKSAVSGAEGWPNSGSAEIAATTRTCGKTEVINCVLGCDCSSRSRRAGVDGMRARQASSSVHSFGKNSFLHSFNNLGGISSSIHPPPCQALWRGGSHFAPEKEKM